MPTLPTPRSDPRLPAQIFTAESQGAIKARADQDLARSVSGLGEALHQRQTQNEINKLNAEFAKAQAELSVEWQDTLRTADPNDEDTARRFRDERVKTRLDSLSGIAQTREAKQYYGRLSSGLGANFLQSTEAGMDELREVAAVQSFETVKNQMGDAVRANPLSFDATRASSRIMVEGYVQSYGMSREQGLKLLTELDQEGAMAAALGRIDTNPDEGRAFVDAGGYSEFLDADKTRQLLDYADNLKASRVAEAKRAETAIDVAAQDEWMEKTATGEFDYAAMVSDNRLLPTSKRSIAAAARAAGKRQQDQTARADEASFTAAYRTDLRKILAGEMGRAEVWAAEAAGRYKDTSASNRLFSALKAVEATPGARPALRDMDATAAARLIKDDPVAGRVDPDGAARHSALMDAAVADLAAGKPIDMAKFAKDIDAAAGASAAAKVRPERLGSTERKYKTIDEYNKARGE